MKEWFILQWFIMQLKAQKTKQSRTKQESKTGERSWFISIIFILNILVTKCFTIWFTHLVFALHKKTECQKSGSFVINLLEWKLNFRVIHIMCQKHFHHKLPLIVQFSSVVSDSETPWTAAHQASLSSTNSQSLLIVICFQFPAFLYFAFLVI